VRAKTKAFPRNPTSIKDNTIIFVTQDGKPCDDGSHLLVKDNKVPAIKDATAERVRILKHECRYLTALVAKTSFHASGRENS